MPGLRSVWGGQPEEPRNTRQAPFDVFSPPVSVREAMGNSNPGGSRLKFGLKQKIGNWVIKMSIVPDLSWKTRGILTVAQMATILCPWFLHWLCLLVPTGQSTASFVLIENIHNSKGRGWRDSLVG